MALLEKIMKSVKGPCLFKDSPRFLDVFCKMEDRLVEWALA